MGDEAQAVTYEQYVGTTLKDYSPFHAGCFAASLLNHFCSACVPAAAAIFSACG